MNPTIKTGIIDDNDRTKAPSKKISVKFIANSIDIMIIKLIPEAVFKSSLKDIVFKSKIVSRIMLVAIPFIIAIGITIIIEFICVKN